MASEGAETDNTAPRSSAPESAAPENSGGIPAEGDVIAGKYRVERVLGEGGMGVVVAARHTSLRQHVAVKFLLPRALTMAGAAERFLREARAAVAIKSEHVARVLDVGELESGAPYMVMEYLTGCDFGKLLRTRGPLPAKEAVDYILQACEALAEAHRLGVVHRDLKPGNLFLTTRADGSPLVKVLDFGLSKAIKASDGGAHEHSLTAPDMIVGSPHYMSPEQLKSLKQVDARTDVWALGVILHQLLSDRRPFEAESLVATCAKIAGDAPITLREHRRDAPVELETIVLRCLQKDMTKRVQSVAELARLLAPFGSDRAAISVERIVRVIEGESSISELSDADVIAQDPTAAVSAWGKSTARPKRTPTTAFVILGALAVCAFAIVFAIRSSGGGTPAAPSSEASAPAASSLAGPVVVPVAAASSTALAPATAASSAPAPDSSADSSASAEPAVSAAPSASLAGGKGSSRVKPGATASAAPTAAPGKPANTTDKMLDRFD